VTPSYADESTLASAVAVADAASASASLVVLRSGRPWETFRHAALSREALKAMLVFKLKKGTLVLFFLGLVTLACGVLAQSPADWKSDAVVGDPADWSTAGIQSDPGYGVR
jgi:hypothetical protein